MWRYLWVIAVAALQWTLPQACGEGAVPSEAKLPADIYPVSAYAVSVSASASLQEALDAHGSVRLLAGDYGAGPITLRSGQEIYGVPGTKVRQIVVEPGTSGALVSMIQGNVVFPESSKVTRANTFLRIYGSITVRGGTLEENLFVDSRALDVDVTGSGYLRNNRFIRAPGQLQGRNMLKFRASPDRPSTGNVFLWVNAGANAGPTTDITGVPQLTIADVDAELWGFQKAPSALFETSAMHGLTIFNVQGGRYDKDTELQKHFGLIDSAAKEVRVFGLTCGYRGQPPDTLPAKIALREGNERSLFVDCLPYSYSLPSTNVLNVRAFVQQHGAPTLALSGSGAGPVAIEPVGALQTKSADLRDMILQTGREMHPWARPVFDTPPNPGGDDWATGLAAAPDSTRTLQDRLDKEGIVVLPAGKFYISAR